MPQELHIAPAGLFTDPSDETAPPGALLTANNVAIRRKGVVQPRPGFDHDKDLDMAGVVKVYRAIPYDDDMVLWTDAGAWWYSNKAEIKDEDSATLVPCCVETMRAAQARGNLYMLLKNGVDKVTAAQDVVTQSTGGARPGTPVWQSEAVGVAVANGKVVRYRVVIKRTDDNGLVVRGIPSHAILYDNDSGGTRDVTFKVYMTDDKKDGDVVELYRSAPFTSGTVPDEELNLVVEQVWNSGGPSSATVVDNTAPADVGATIYTAPSQEGALQENNIPPRAKDIAFFKGSMFYSNTEGFQRVNLRVKTADDNNQVGDATGFGRRTMNCNTTSGSPVLAVADPTGLEVGQLITSDWMPANAYVASIAGSNVTATEDATDTKVAGTTHFIDVVTLGTADTHTVFPVSYGTLVNIAIAINSREYSSDWIARVISEYPHDTYPDAHGQLSIESADQGEDPWFMWATHGEAYFPVLSGPTYAGGEIVYAAEDGLESDASIHENCAMWSKRDQPEHVPETNFTLIGSKAHPLQRIIPTRDALFIFKLDGIWRLTGAGEKSGWRVDEFELGTRLIRPDTVVEMDSVIYAWTNKGAVAITDAGVVRISETAIGTDLKVIEQTLLADDTTTASCFVMANLKDNEVIFGVPGSTGTSWLDRLYVFNVKTLAWYQWALPGGLNEGQGVALYYLVSNPADAKMYAFSGLSGTEAAYVERNADDRTDASDREYAASVTGATGATVTISAGSGWTPAVGDAIYSSSGDTFWGVIVSVASATVFTTDNDDAAAFFGAQPGAITAYVAYQSDIEWVAKTAQNPGLVKHYHNGAYVFADFSGIARATYKWTSSLSTTPTSMTEEFTLTTDNISRTCRFPVPAAHARVSHLYPELEIKQAGSRWEMTGLSLWFVPMAERGVNK